MRSFTFAYSMHANLRPIRYFEMYILCCSNRICACPSGRSCFQVTPPSGLCFAGVLIHFRSGKFQALDMSYFSIGHAGFFREFGTDMVITFDIRPEDDIEGNTDIWVDVQTPLVIPLCKFLNHIYVFDIVYSKIVDN